MTRLRPLLFALLGGIVLLSLPALTATPVIVHAQPDGTPSPPVVTVVPALNLPPLAPAPPTATPFAEPAGCLRPPDDYSRVQLGYATLNARTLAMLDHAQSLHRLSGGTIIDFRLAITQGSYNPGGVAASFGTHDSGGAVDISVRSRVDWSVMEDEIAPMITALRTAGFAAWLREADSLHPGSPIHIHAIAVGDAELSPAAQAQITGPQGYFAGCDGLPHEDGTCVPDPHGGPLLCAWMLALE